MKNKIFTILVLTMLSLPIQVWAVDDVLDSAPVQEENVINQKTDEEIEEQPITSYKQTSAPYKQPVSKKKIVLKFLAAMGGVTISSLILYVGLSLYNKLRSGHINKINTQEGETSLKTPDDLDEAIKTFLEKTKWN